MVRLLATMLGVFLIITILWYCFYQVVYALIGAVNATVPSNSMARSVANLIQNVWNWFPVIFLVLLLIFAVVYIQREEARSRIEGY